MKLNQVLLRALRAGAADASQLAARLGVDAGEVVAMLDRLGRNGLVDFHEPPPPCGRERATWFIVPAARPRVAAALGEVAHG